MVYASDLEELYCLGRAIWCIRTTGPVSLRPLLFVTLVACGMHRVTHKTLLCVQEG